MNFTHVLSVVVWSDKTNQTTNYGNILTKVKSAIVEDIQTQEIMVGGKKELYSLNWQKMNNSAIDKNLYGGDIITYAPSINNDVMYQHTQKTLHELEEKMCMKKKFDSDYKILFSIVKPVFPSELIVEYSEFTEI